MVKPNGIFFGVDTQASANGPRPYQGRRMTRFEYAVERIGERPQFWGRYLGPPGEIQPQEVRYLHGQGCRILLVYHGPRHAERVNHLDNSAVANRRAYHFGESAARRAIQRTEVLAQGGTRVPDGVRIYADLEAYRVHPNWFLGWFDVMSQSRFAGAGGIYGRPYRVMERPELEDIGIPRLGTRVRQERLRNRFDPRNPALSQPVEERFRPGIVRGSEGYRRAELDALMLGNRAAANRLSRVLWVNEPRRYGEPDPGEDIFPSTFSPARVAGCRSEVWQYRANCFRPPGARHGLDLDYATRAGFSEMWG